MRLDDARAMAFLLRRFSLPHWRVILALLVASLASATLATIQPLLLAPALDTAVATTTPPARSLADMTLNNVGPTLLRLVSAAPPDPLLIIVTVAVIYVLVGAVLSGTNFVAYRLSVHLRILTILDLQRSLYRHILLLPMSFHLEQRTGVLFSRLTDDVTSLANTFEPIVRGLIQSGIQIAFYAAVLFRTEPVLATATLGVSLTHLATTRLLQGRLRARVIEHTDATAEVFAAVQEGLVGIRVIKSFAAESFEVAKLDRMLKGFKAIWTRLSVVQSLEDPLRRFTDSIAVGLVLLIAFRALSVGTLTVPGFALFIYMARATLTPIAQFSSALVLVHGFLGSSTRILEIFRRRSDMPSGRLPSPILSEAIRLEDVSFAYRPGLPVLHRVSFEIRKGEVTALVGASGSGKSTAVDLVLRLFDPASGRVAIDGVDLREIEVTSYREQFGVVSQEALLFNTTVRDNIVYGRRMDPAEVRRAAAMANADDFVQRLADGYDTRVGDRGTRLSGGQRQRVAIARALYGRPAVLVLDEATSALDAESERAIQDALSRAIGEMTTIVIAHRLSTIVRAHRIVFLREGRVMAIGTHRELLATSPDYRRLYELQLHAPQPVEA